MHAIYCCSSKKMDSVSESFTTSPAAPQTRSILQENQCFANKILSRKPSVGCSSHFYYRNTGDVPFKWEVKPGKPKDPTHDNHDDGVIFPSSLGPPVPPPAVHSQGPSRPSVESSPQSRIFLLKKFIKNLKVKKFKAMSTPLVRENIFDHFEYSAGDKFDKIELSNSDDDFGGSRYLTSSSLSNGSSSSSSGSVLALYQLSKLQNLGKGFVRWALKWREH